MKRNLLLLCGMVGLILRPGYLAGQDGQFAISGSVTNSVTGEPIRRALVTLVHIGPPVQNAAPIAPASQSALTDASGLFRFQGLAAGNYSLNSSKPEFTQPQRSPPTEGSNRFMQLSASVNNVGLRLAPLSAISGKVVNQNGEPVRGARVIAVTMRMQDGLWKTATDRNVSTDDRGMYRFWNLTPGKYYVKAAGHNGGTNTYAGDMPPWYTSDQAFAPVYAGGAKTLENASPTVIEPGTEAHVDLTVKLETAYKIRGTASNFAPGAAVKFELSEGDENVTQSRVSMNSNTGRFEIQDVVSGDYILRASQDDRVAEIPLQLAAGDVNGVQLALATGFEIKALSRFAGTPPEESEFSRGRFGAMCNVALRSLSRKTQQTYAVVAGDQAAVGDRPPNMPDPARALPGVYQAGIACYGGYPTSALWGNQDLLTNPTFVVSPGVQPPPIEISAAYGGGTMSAKLDLKGSVKGEQLGLIAVPQSGAAGGIEMRFVLNTGDIGIQAFSFANLAPGAYTVYAFSRTGEIEFRNPAFLKTLTGGVTVQVDDKAEKTVTITEVVR